MTLLNDREPMFFKTVPSVHCEPRYIFNSREEAFACLSQPGTSFACRTLATQISMQGYLFFSQSSYKLNTGRKHLSPLPHFLKYQIPLCTFNTRPSSSLRMSVFPSILFMHIPLLKHNGQPVPKLNKDSTKACQM